MTTGRFIYIFRNMNIRSFADATGIDYERLMDEFCGDTKALSTSIRSYLDTCDLPSLVKSVKDGDEEAVRSSAHRIRKCAEKLLLDETASLARKLEEAPAERMHSLVTPLEKEFARFTAALEQ